MEEATSSDHKRKLATHKRTYNQSNAGAGVACTHLVTCSILQVLILFDSLVNCVSGQRFPMFPHVPPLNLVFDDQASPVPPSTGQ